MGYENGRIYRIVCNASGKQYIGSTTQPLSKRLSKHKADFMKWKNGKHRYMKSFDIVENGDYEIVLIEDYPCKSKNELERRERYYIETMECVNRNRPAQTREERLEHMKQYYEENKDKINEQMKQYYRENKEKINEKQSQKHDCECGVAYTQSNRARHLKSKKHQEWEQQQTTTNQP